jgi:hypothetical protein
MTGDAIIELSDRLLRPVQIGDVIAKPEGWTLHDPTAVVDHGPLPDTVEVSTLGAVRDYLTANKDGLSLAALTVHVYSPNRVQVLAPLNVRDASRATYLGASCDDSTANWLDRYHAIEDFVVGFQTRFADAADRPRLLALIGNVKHESVKTAADDGVTQIVQARAGVALVSEVPVPNPVRLTPYRTFREVAQPDSLFVLRVKAGPAGFLPVVGLFEADGGAWRLTAIERVRAWLAEALPKEVAVLA